MIWGWLPISPSLFPEGRLSADPFWETLMQRAPLTQWMRSIRTGPCAGSTRKRECVSRQAPTRRAFASKRKQQESFLLPLFRQRLGQRVYTQSAPTQEEPSNLGGIIFSESSHAALFLVGHTMSSISTLLNELLYQRR